MPKTKIAGWVLSVLLALFFILLSARGKLTDFEGKEEAFQHIGYSTDVMYGIGIVEVACTILFLIPRTGFVGAILLTGYLGGAVATHVRIDEPFYAPIVVGIVVWVALGLRKPGVFCLARGGCSRSPTRNEPDDK